MQNKNNNKSIMILRSIIILLLINISCTPKADYAAFKSTLGANNSAMLDALIVDFEQNYLNTHYKNKSMDDAYHHFLIDLKSGKINERIKASPDIIHSLKRSALYNELYVIIDTVWHNSEDDVYYIKNKYLQQDGTYESITTQSRLIKRANIDINAEIKRLYETKERNLASKYWQAIKQESISNAELNEYVQTIESLGSPMPHAMASGLLDAGLEIDNYLMKVLIVTELVEY